MIRKATIIGILLLTLALGACSTGVLQKTGSISNADISSTVKTPSIADAGKTEVTTLTYVPVSVDYDHDDYYTDWVESSSTKISLDGDSVSVSGSGVRVNRTTARIIAAGTYIISGTLENGRIVVDAGDDSVVRLILDGADITSLTNAPVYIISADKVIITLVDGSCNYLADGDSYTYDDPGKNEPNAALFSKSDLTINGEGSLEVTASFNNGIQSKDSLVITGGNITVNAVNEGIKGKDNITIRSGSITIDAGGDGLQSTNDSVPEKGWIAIEGGTLNINAKKDGIQAETNVLISGGDISVISGTGSSDIDVEIDWRSWWKEFMNPSQEKESVNSTKGIKAKINLTIKNGTINIDSADDALHSNGTLYIDSGIITLASGDDGIHADSAIDIAGGTIDITKSYEGIESNIITINDGSVRLVAGDDGFNAVNTTDNSTLDVFGGWNMFDETIDSFLYINGGKIYIDAGGDGIDVNGPIAMTSGYVIVNGPVYDINGALDYLGTFTVTDGFIVAAGSAGMAEAPSESSTQYSLMINFDSQLAAGTLFHIETQDGEELLTFAPSKIYQSMVVSSPELEKGETYVVYSGGSASGSSEDGIYTDGNYSPGTQVATFTITDKVTYIGDYPGMFTGGGFQGGGMKRR